MSNTFFKGSEKILVGLFPPCYGPAPKTRYVTRLGYQGVEVFSESGTVSNTFKQCPTYFPEIEEIFSRMCVRCFEVTCTRQRKPTVKINTDK